MREREKERARERARERERERARERGYSIYAVIFRTYTKMATQNMAISHKAAGVKFGKKMSMKNNDSRESRLYLISIFQSLRCQRLQC